MRLRIDIRPTEVVTRNSTGGNNSKFQVIYIKQEPEGKPCIFDDLIQQLCMQECSGIFTRNDYAHVG